MCHKTHHLHVLLRLALNKCTASSYSNRPLTPLICTAADTNRTHSFAKVHGLQPRIRKPNTSDAHGVHPAFSKIIEQFTVSTLDFSGFWVQ